MAGLFDKLRRKVRKSTGQEEPYEREGTGEGKRMQEALDRAEGESTAEKIAREYNELMKKKKKKD